MYSAALKSDMGVLLILRFVLAATGFLPPGCDFYAPTNYGSH